MRGIVKVKNKEPIPRLVPENRLPPYAYTPGQSPHPTRDSDGHKFKIETETNDTFTHEGWETCVPYLFGFDLFNLGFYWEAHESWEALWHTIGRKGSKATFLKGLIKLAATGVKARQGSNSGVKLLADGAKKLFKEVDFEHQDLGGDYRGLELKALIAITEQVKAIEIKKNVMSGKLSPRVFDFILLPIFKKSV